MREHWNQAAAFGFLTFVVLWVVGFVHGLTQPLPPPPAWHLPSREEFVTRQQVANNLKQLGLAAKALPLMLDQADVARIQVYEQTATLASGTAAFDEDEALVRAALRAHGAAVFNEKNSGILPQRVLRLEIGVPPEQFDALVEDLRQIGHLDAVSVERRDRTGEFRKLHAQRLALKKHLEAVLKLRGAGKATIDDTLKVEQKIQDVEKELQSLGVQLGDLLGKESFYQVQATLSEYQAGSRQDRTQTLARRVGQAFLWALTWWFLAAGVVGVLAGTFVSAQTLWPRRSIAGVPPSPVAPA